MQFVLGRELLRLFEAVCRADGVLGLDQVVEDRTHFVGVGRIQLLARDVALFRKILLALSHVLLHLVVALALDRVLRLLEHPVDDQDEAHL